VRANVTFKIVRRNEEPFDEEEGGPKLTRAHVKRSFTGDLTGAGNLTYVTHTRQDRVETALSPAFFPCPSPHIFSHHTEIEANPSASKYSTRTV